MKFADAIRMMAMASSNAKANDWGVEPHVDVLTTDNEVVYIFDSKREALSMQRELQHGIVLAVPSHWKPIINEAWHETILAKGVYWAVYDASLRITEDISGMPITRVPWSRC